MLLVDASPAVIFENLADRPFSSCDAMIAASLAIALAASFVLERWTRPTDVLPRAIIA
jgi:hypothetical protein